MNVGRVRSRRPVTVNPRLREAAELMHEKHVGFLGRGAGRSALATVPGG